MQQRGKSASFSCRSPGFKVGSGRDRHEGFVLTVGLDRPLLPPPPTATFLSNSWAPVGSLTARLTLSINLIPGGCSGGNQGSCLHLFLSLWEARGG